MIAGLRHAGLSRFMVAALCTAPAVYVYAASHSWSPSMNATLSAQKPVHLERLSPVLIVDAVEPCIQFWTDRLGFTIENKVPGPDGKLVFASVKSGDVEIMYQTRASVLADTPAADAADLHGHSTALFITVNDLDNVEKAIAGAPVVKPRHKTFYGSLELYVREPGGNTVGFAQFARAQ
jgi:uncharacterized glyoxalase superfamily protein PhnB